jgi:hypothetical protein
VNVATKVPLIQGSYAPTISERMRPGAL